MEFSGQYLSYENYRALGGTLDITPFNLLEFEARRKIDGRTQNRLVNKDIKSIPQAVKLCEFKLINKIETYLKVINNINVNGRVASENTDGYSVSYVTSERISEVIKSKQSEIEDIIETYLLNVIFEGEHLLYLGAR